MRNDNGMTEQEWDVVVTRTQELHRGVDIHLTTELDVFDMPPSVQE